MRIDAGSKGLARPFVRVVGGQDDGEISASEATRLRALAVTSNCLAGDRPEIQFGVKDLYPEMAAPTIRHGGGALRTKAVIGLMWLACDTI